MLNTINLARLTKIIVPPVLCVLKRILNSLWRVDINEDQRSDHREGIAQNR